MTFLNYKCAFTDIDRMPFPPPGRPEQPRVQIPTWRVSFHARSKVNARGRRYSFVRQQSKLGFVQLALQISSRAAVPVAAPENQGHSKAADFCARTGMQ